MTQPFASIIVPTYNQAGYLKDALDSILAQTDPSWEAIVVNDGSTDDTAAVIEAYAARDARFRPVHKKNGGVASALNEGIRRASGQWIHWLSSDDMFEPTKLAINRAWSQRYPEARFFFSYFTLFREADGSREKRELWGPVPKPEHQILTMFYRNYISGITICIDRESWNEIGFFDERFYYAQDYHLWLRFLQKHRAVFIPEWTVINRNHPGQGSEIFPDACYFDTAKAGLDFINRHAFAELVPGVDLGDREQAVAAVEAALTVAADPTSFIYALGPTPSLALRTLDWVFSANLDPAPSAPNVRALARDMVVREALVPGNDDFRLMWRMLASEVVKRDARFAFTALDLRQHERVHYARLVPQSVGRAEALRGYIRRFEGEEVGEGVVDALGSLPLVLYGRDLPEEVRACVEEAATILAGQGHRPVLLLGTGCGFETAAGIVRLGNADAEGGTLSWLGGAVGVAIGGPASVWLRADTHVEVGVEDARNPDLLVRRIIEALRPAAAPQPARTVVFLQRVLRGGGAEEVVRQLATHLDRTRYRPVVATLFDDAPDANHPADVPVVCVRRHIFDRIRAPHHVPAPEAAAPPEAVAAPPPAERPPLVAKVAAVLRRSPQLRKVVGRARGVMRRVRDQVGEQARFQHERTGRALYAGAGAVARRLFPASRPVPVSGVGLAHEAQVQSSPAALHFAGRHGAFLTALDSSWPAGEGLRAVVSDYGCGPQTLVVSIMEEATVAAWLAQHGSPIPYLASLHTVESRYLATMYPDPLRYEAERWAFANACRDAQAIVFPSEGCGRDLVQFAAVNEKSLRTIGNPVDCTQVRRLSYEKTADQFRHGGEKLFVSLGRLDSVKGHRFLFEAFRRFRERVPECRLVCVGDGPDRQALTAAVAEMGLSDRVHLVGHRDNPYPILRQADALVLTSEFEAFALVLVEAMVCGVPVLAVDCPFGPSEVLEGGRHGLLVPPGDPEAFATAMERIATDERLRQDLVASGYERALDYDVARIVRQWQKLIDETASATS